MKVIGLVGGVASGKSTVARAFEACGAVRVDADGIGHQVLQQEEVRAAIRNRWGAAVFDEQGQVNRQRLAARVFDAGQDGEQQRRALEAITHPRIRIAIEERLDRLRDQGVPAAVLDVPLLLEVGWHALCDVIVFVDCPDYVRRQRAVSRGWTREQWQQREAAQWPLEKKRELAGAVVNNDDEIEATRARVAKLWASWRD